MSSAKEVRLAVRKPVRVAFALLCLVPFLMVLGNSMLFPVFPKLQQALNVSEVRTSLIVTAFSVPAGVLIPIAGYLSDRLGRKPVMVPAVFIFGIGALIAGLSAWLLGRGAFLGLIIGRVIQGVGAAGMAQLAMALTADIFQSNERSKALGLLEGANGLGKVISPIAGAAAGLVLWWLPFWIFALLAIPSAGAIWFFVKEPQQQRADTNFAAYLRLIVRLFRHKGASMAAVLFAGGVLFFVLFGTLFFLSETLEKTYHMAQLTVGFVLALPVAAMSASSYGIGVFLQKRSRLAKTTVWLGLLLVLVVMVVNAVWHSRLVLLISISLLGLGAGTVIPSLTLLITSSTEERERGLITSLYGGVRFFGVAIGPPTFGLLMQRGTTLVFAVAALVTFSSFLVTVLLVRPRQMLGDRGGGRRQAAGRKKAVLRGGIRL